MVRRRGRSEAGVLLVYSLLVLLLVSTAVLLATAALMLRMRVFQGEQRSVHLTALSDAVLAESLAALAEDTSFRGYEEYAFGGGQLESEVRSLGWPRVELVTTVRWRGGSRRVRAEVNLEQPGRPRVVAWRRLPSPSQGREATAVISSP